MLNFGHVCNVFTVYFIFYLSITCCLPIKIFNLLPRVTPDTIMAALTIPPLDGCCSFNMVNEKRKSKTFDSVSYILDRNTIPPLDGCCSLDMVNVKRKTAVACIQKRNMKTTSTRITLSWKCCWLKANSYFSEKQKSWTYMMKEKFQHFRGHIAFICTIQIMIVINHFSITYSKLNWKYLLNIHNLCSDTYSSDLSKTLHWAYPKELKIVCREAGI